MNYRTCYYFKILPVWFFGIHTILTLHRMKHIHSPRDQEIVKAYASSDIFIYIIYFFNSIETISGRRFVKTSKNID